MTTAAAAVGDDRVPTPVCLRVGELRKIGFSNLEAYDADVRNARVTRAGRVSVKRDTDTSSKATYAFGASPWANPYKVGTGAKKFTLADSLHMYEKKLLKLLEREDLLANFMLLGDKETIGCFCPLTPNGKKPQCHRDIIIQVLKMKKRERRLQEQQNGAPPPPPPPDPPTNK